MNMRLLEEIGLTEGETKVYLALLRLGTTKTGPLAKEARVSSSKVYKILDRLVVKGLAGHVVRGRIKYFSAMEPKRILEYMDEKEKEFNEKKELIKKMLPELEYERNLSNKNTEATVFEGFNAIKNFYNSILEELKSGDEYFVIGANYGDVVMSRPFFEEYHKRRSHKKIKVKMLANYNTKENLVKSTYLNSNIKFLPQYLFTNMVIIFYGRKTFIIIWSKNPTGFLIENEDAVKSFKAYFDTFWKIAKS